MTCNSLFMQFISGVQ